MTRSRHVPIRALTAGLRRGVADGLGPLVIDSHRQPCDRPASGWSQPWTTPEACPTTARDELRARLGRQPYHVPVGGPGGAFAILAEDDACAGWRATVGEQSKWRHEIPARLTFRLATHRPGRHASTVSCPLLVQVVEFESVVHNAPAVRAAAEAPRGELRRYPTLRHFDSYTGNGFETDG